MKRTKNQKDDKIKQLEAQLKQANERLLMLDEALKTASNAALAQDDRHRKTIEENHQIVAAIEAKHYNYVLVLRRTIDRLLDQLAPTSAMSLAPKKM